MNTVDMRINHSIEQFESLQAHVAQINILKRHMRKCYENMIEARELRKSINTAYPKNNKDLWMKGQEQFWKKAYWKAASSYQKAVSV